MAKKSLLGNIIGESKSPSSDTNSQKASDNLGTNNERKNETNGGGETPTVTIEKEKPSAQERPTPIEKETPRPTPQETLILSHPVKQEPIETKNVSGSIRISPEEMTYIDQLVKHKRMSGYTDYTKKEALSEALTLLMDKYPKEKLLS